MAKSREHKSGTFSSGSTLSQEDADKFARDAKIYAANATTSKVKARNTLRSLGINPQTGNVTKRRG